MMRWKQFFIPVQNMEADEVRSYMAEHGSGDYTLLDVRQAGEYERARMPGGLLIPLPELTDRLGELDPAKPTIIY
jgi:rhodanese-related sulfurtransferase